MTWLGALIALVTEVLRLINKSGGVPNATAILKSVNDTYDKVDAAKTPEDYQNAAKAVSELESDS